MPGAVPLTPPGPRGALASLLKGVIMRRLLVFCDGTWNKETAGELTNVVSAAQNVKAGGR